MKLMLKNNLYYKLNGMIKMKLKQSEYKLIEITEDEEYGMVIGNIVTQDDKFNYAEIIDSTICNYKELENIRTFLNKIEKVMNNNPK